MGENSNHTAPQGITLHLLDPSKGYPIQSWQFHDEPLIRIGRGENNHVVIRDQYVSRVHAEIEHRGDHWWLANLGRNGIVVGGKRVESFRIDGECRFKLGREGPAFLFEMSEVNLDPSATVVELRRDWLTPMIEIDQESRDSQVSEITGTDYFRKLTEVSQELREKISGTGESDETT